MNENFSAMCTGFGIINYTCEIIFELVLFAYYMKLIVGRIIVSCIIQHIYVNYFLVVLARTYIS